MPTQKMPRELSDEALDQIAQRFAALSEPTRLKLIHALFGGEKSVGELVEIAGTTQANVSRHLQQLAQSGILGRRKQGLQVFYSIADQTIYDLCELVCGSLAKQADARSAVFS